MQPTPVYRPSVTDLPPRDTWSALEKDLWAECKLGRHAVLPGKEALPEDCEDMDCRVRAAFIRYLMWGGSDEEGGIRPHPKGVQIRGGWIKGRLDLQACVASIDLSMHNCRFPDAVTLQDAQIGGLYMTGSHVAQKLQLHRLKTAREVHLSGGFEAEGPVDLASARIGGQLDCSGGTFNATEGLALDCEVAEIGTDVFLFGGFEAAGLVDFHRADVTGNVRVTPRGGDTPVLRDGIDFEGAKIGGGLFWKSVGGERKVVDLTEAKVGSLRDDWASWEGVGEVRLDGFEYGRVEGSMSVERRLEGLGKACGGKAVPVDVGPNFDPQPHVQLANVLRRQGNRDGAARVLVDREARQRWAEKRRSDATVNGDVSPAFASLKGDARAFFGWVFGILFGYGHRPMRAVWASVLLIGLTSGLNGMAYRENQFAPNDAVVLTSAEWQAAVAEEGPEGHPLAVWRGSRAAQDYETFHSVLYGLDLFLPLDALGQEEAWRATTGAGFGGTQRSIRGGSSSWQAL